MMAIIKKYRVLVLMLLLVIGWGLFFYFIPADALVESVGVQNSYLVSFLISLVAGFSTFTGTTAYATVIEFSRGGANPLWLGIVSGTGIFLSDSFFYALAMKGRESIQTSSKRLFTVIQRISDKVPNIVVYIGIYAFSAFGPIPNDIILVALVVTGYKYRRFWPMLLAGDITFMLFLSYLFH